MTDAAFEARVAARLVELHPDGCGIEGHRCEACHARLGEAPHAVDSWVAGARPGYRGVRRERCAVRGCPRRSA